VICPPCQERCFQGVGAISEGKMPLGRLGHSWKDDIRMHLKDIGWVDVN